MNIEVNREKETALATLGTAILAEAEQFRTIRDDDHRALAVTLGQKLRGQIAIVGELYDEPIAKANALHKDLCGRRKRLLDPLEAALQIPSRSVGAYDQAKRDEADRLRRKAEAEQRRITQEAEAERQRLLDVARAAEEERRLVEAQKLKDAGRDKAADAMLAAPLVVAVPPPVQVSAPPPVVYTKPTDAKNRDNWKFRVLDVNVVPREYLMLDEVKIGKVVRALKGETKIAGIDLTTT